MNAIFANDFQGGPFFEIFTPQVDMQFLAITPSFFIWQFFFVASVG